MSTARMVPSLWDNHVCLPLRPGDETLLPQIERFSRAGVTVVSINVGFGPQPLELTLRTLAHFRAWFAARPDRFVLAGSVADLDRARAQGKLAVVFDLEGMAPLDAGDHGMVEMLAGLGVRWMLVAYNRNNAAGGGCMDEDGGLTAHGRAILKSMKRAGMVACCSHTGWRTAREVIEAADNPVIFSHSNAHAVHAHRRNIPDDLIDACAATGGVVGVNGLSAFLGAGEASVEGVVRHVDHIAQRVGSAHVGLALDYVFDREELAEFVATMQATFPDELQWREPLTFTPPEAWPAILQRLLDLGYGEAAVAQIAGGNWRRVAETVWR